MYAQINRFKKSKTKEIPIYSGVKLVNEELGIEYNGSLSIIYKEKEFQVDLGHKLMVEERLVLLLEIFSKIVYLGNERLIGFRLNDLKNSTKNNNKLSIFDEVMKRVKNNINLNEIDLQEYHVLKDIIDSYHMIDESLKIRYQCC